jgi:hypothetical protein
MTYKPNQLFACCTAAVLFFSCSSNEIGQSKDVNPETIYQYYKFEYNEHDKSASLFAQFRFAGENGTTLVLTAPARLEYNGDLLKVDSNSFSGAYYGAAIPLSKAAGKHTLVFTDGERKKYENSFTVDSFYLTGIPATISRLAPALIRFKAPVLLDEDFIALESEGTDSSFSVKYTAGDKDGYITIPAAELQRQKSNEIFIVPSLYRKTKLQQQAKEGGEIITIQTLKPVKLKLADEAL